MIKVLLADDHKMFREGVRSLLEAEGGFEIAGEAGTGRETLQKCRELKPDVLILDLDLPELDGMEVTRRVKEENLNVRILILTMHTNEEYAVRLLQAGALGFLPKYSSGQILPEAVRRVAKGNNFIVDEMRENVLARMIETKKTEAEILSDRELQVFKAFAEGKTTKEIAEALFISPRTVETHKSRIMEKMNLRNTAELVKAAIRLDLISKF